MSGVAVTSTFDSCATDSPDVVNLSIQPENKFKKSMLFVSKLHVSLFFVWVGAIHASSISKQIEFCCLSINVCSR